MKKKFISIAHDFNVLIAEVISSTGVFNPCDMMALQRRDRAMIALGRCIAIQREILLRCSLNQQLFKECISEYGTIDDALNEYEAMYGEEKEKLKEFLQLDIAR
ncbi:MAG: hypothetical protein ACRC23_01485 [Aeromonas jandaei]